MKFLSKSPNDVLAPNLGASLWMSPLRIAIVGAESTGKSWLSRALHHTLVQRGQSVQVIPEVLRAWCDRHGRTPHAHEQLDIATAQAHASDMAHAPCVVCDTTPLMTAVYSHLLFGDQSLYPMALAHQAGYSCTLLTGLDLPWVADGLQRDGPHLRGPVDALVRQALERAGIAYRVVYGQGPQRLNNALLALDLQGDDVGARTMRENAQFAINGGRTVWQCNECSDPACEHKLFTGLLAKRLT
jgi:nicotinamide riboside kinase